MENNNKNYALRKFNETITIQVQLDTVAEMLYSKMNQNDPLAIPITEQIIGSMRHAPNGISRLYNALIGYPNQCSYKVGDVVYVSPGDLSVWNWHESCKKLKAVPATITAVDEFALAPYTLSVQFLHKEVKYGQQNTQLTSAKFVDATDEFSVLCNELIHDLYGKAEENEH